MAESILAPTRVCKLCQQELAATLDNFPPHKMGKYGLHTHCRPCKKTADAERRARPDQKARQQAWRDANKEWVKNYNEQYRANGYKSTEHVREWYHKNIEHARAFGREKARAIRIANPEKFRLLARARYWANQEHSLKIARQYRERNRLLVNQRASRAVAEKYRRDPAFNLSRKMAARLRRLIKDKAGQSTLDIFGYSRAELLEHIERQFTKGMTWDKVLSGEIHIDHIRPVSSFKISGLDDPQLKECWALANLRPLWAKDNLSKSDKLEFLL